MYIGEIYAFPLVEAFAEYYYLQIRMNGLIRSRGSDFGIAVDEDDLAKEWQSLNKRAMEIESRFLTKRKEG